jgi:hypothetical protein
MAIQSFFTSPADVNLAKDVLTRQTDAYIQRKIYAGSGVYANTTAGTSTLTPATSPVWTISELVSTVAKNVFIVDNNGKVAAAKIAANTATALTFDETACLLEEDEATAATFTPGSTYNFYVFTPCSVAGQLYGPFFGYGEGLEPNIEDDVITFKYGFPRKSKFSDLRERTGTLSGGHVNFIKKDIAKVLFDAEDFGDNSTGKSSVAIGSGSSCTAKPEYRLTLVGSDRACKTTAIIFRQLTFRAAGSFLSESADGYSMANFEAQILSDSFYPAGADMVQIKRY